MDHVLEDAKEGDRKGNRPAPAANTASAVPPTHPMLQLQQQAGNQAVGTLLQSGQQPSIAPLNQPSLAVIKEAGFSPEDNASSLERLGTGASQTGKVMASAGSQGIAGQGESTYMHLDATGEGARGSVASSTDLVLSFSPDTTVLAVGTSDTGISAKSDPHQAYPGVLQYSRTLNLTDSSGRKCAVEITGFIHFSQDAFLHATQFKPLTPETLMQLRGDKAAMTVRLHGTSPVQNYTTFLEISGSDEDLSTLSQTAARLLGSPRTGPGVISKEEAGFVQAELTAGEQFDSLEDFLQGADNEEIGRRVMADLDRLAGGDIVPAGTEPGKAEPSNDGGGLGGLLKTVLLGIGAGLLIVGAIFAVAAAFGVSLAVAAAAVMGTLIATAFVNALMGRYKEAMAAGVNNPASIFSAAVLDTVGAGQIHEAITNKSLLTGRDLKRSAGERVGGAVAGLIQLFMTAVGVRDTVKTGAPVLDEPDVPTTPAAGAPTGEVDASHFNTPEDYLTAIRNSPKSSTVAGQAWDHARFPRGPRPEWQPGDPIDMPDADGIYPKWGTARPRFWRNRAAIELDGRTKGLRAQSPDSTDPISAMSDADLETLRDTPKSRVRSPRDPTSGRAMEIEHFGVQQQVAGWLEDANFSPSDARRICGVADPHSLIEASPVEHAFWDKEAHGFGSRRADPSGNMWTQTPWSDPRVGRPLVFMTDGSLAEIAARARTDPSINLSKVPNLLSALRAEAAARGLSIQFP